MDHDDIARHLLGATFDEIEADAETWISRGHDAVKQWRWMPRGETLWERPFAMQWESEAMRFLPSEPPPQKKHTAVLRGFDVDGRAIAARYFTDTRSALGVPFVDVVWVNEVMLLFSYERDASRRLSFGSLELADYDGQGRLIETTMWSRVSHGTQRHEWDGDRLLRTVATSPSWTSESSYEYDEHGLLRVTSAITWSRHSETTEPHVVWYRRSPTAVKNARKLVRDELADRVAAWVRRVAPDEPVWGLALMYSVDAPGIPPALGLCTRSELTSWRHQYPARMDFVSMAFNPAEYRIFEPEPAELADRSFADACAVLTREWELAESEREPRATLLRAARQMAERDWSQDVVLDGDFVVFVAEDETDEQIVRKLRQTIPRDVLRRLETP